MYSNACLNQAMIYRYIFTHIHVKTIAMHPTTLLLITAAPNHVLAWHALGVAQAFLRKKQPFQLFFYQDAVLVANNINWVPDDQRLLTQEWQKLNIALPVCVSAALTRGICDAENAKRHQKPQHNLADGFELVGLGHLADAMQHCKHTIQF